jgi:hypothetical protein
LTRSSLVTMQHSPYELDGGTWCDSSSFSSSTMKVNLSQTNKGWIDKMVKHFSKNFTSESMSMFRCSMFLCCVQNAPDSALNCQTFFPMPTPFLNLLRFFFPSIYQQTVVNGQLGLCLCCFFFFFSSFCRFYYTRVN